MSDDGKPEDFEVTRTQTNWSVPREEIEAATEDPFRYLARVHEEMVARELFRPVVTRFELPSTLLRALYAQLPIHERPKPNRLTGATELDGVTLGVNQQLPHRTVRAYLSDGTFRDLKL